MFGWKTKRHELIMHKLSAMHQAQIEIGMNVQSIIQNLESLRKINEDAIINKEVITKFVDDLRQVVAMAELKDGCERVQKSLDAEKKKVGRPKKHG